MRWLVRLLETPCRRGRGPFDPGAYYYNAEPEGLPLYAALGIVASCVVALALLIAWPAFVAASRGARLDALVRMSDAAHAPTVQVGQALLIAGLVAAGALLVLGTCLLCWRGVLRRWAGLDG